MIIYSLYTKYFSLVSRAIVILSSARCKIKMRLLGIKYGSNTLFRGNAIIWKSPNGKIEIGNNAVFNSSSRFNFRGINHECILQTKGPGIIQIGDNCGFSGVSIVSSKSVLIGNDVLCGTNVIIGDRNDHEDRYPQFIPENVIIGNNVWIGMNSVVLKGVHIGDNVIIGANSVVTKDIPSNSIAVGVPCKVIKSN